MVLQRDKPVRISGSATVGESVRVSIGRSDYANYEGMATTGSDGRWQVTLPARHRGGPYVLCVQSGSGGKVEFEDVWFGEVWICSGQSNMQYPMIGEEFYFSHPHGAVYADAATDPLLRVFLVPRAVSAGRECTDFPGRPSWTPMIGRDAFREVSAVAYFFASRLREELGPDVPVGIVSTSWGGTLIEPWIPYAAYEKEGFTAIASEVKAARDQASLPANSEGLKKLNAGLQAKLVEWVNEKFLRSAPEVSREAIAQWGQVDVDRSHWKVAPREKMEGLASPGIAWYRFEFALPEKWEKANLLFHVDFINDCDETYFNGTKIGETRVEDGGAYWAKARDYAFRAPAEGGRQVIAVRAMDHRGMGEVHGRVYLENVDSGEVLPLDAGPWMERVEFKADVEKLGERPPPPMGDVTPSLSNGAPSSLFNAMIAPATCAAVRGAIWYQGCSNAYMGERYAAYQKALIRGWRDAWNDPELVFLITQLSAYEAHNPNGLENDLDFWKAQEPKDCLGYGPIRKAQDSCRTLPRTGVACTIDIGEPFDIHPSNKEDVGARLANEALRIAYGRADCLPGPRFATATRDGEKVMVRFENLGGGLNLEGGRLNPHLVALAGADGVFHWGEGELDTNETLVVWSEAVKEPVRVQYCHSAYPPNVNLRRVDDGYPVFPFDEEVSEDGAR